MGARPDAFHCIHTGSLADIASFRALHSVWRNSCGVAQSCRSTHSFFDNSDALEFAAVADSLDRAGYGSGGVTAYAITATLARLPRRTTIRAGRAGSLTFKPPNTSPSYLTAFSAILRLASVPLAASPICTNNFGICK